MGLQQQLFITHGLEAGASKIKVPADSVSGGEDPPPGSYTGGQLLGVLSHVVEGVTVPSGGPFYKNALPIYSLVPSPSPHLLTPSP